jgi:hypothetical protein
MTKEQSRKIKDFFDKGYLVLIKDTWYVDSEVKNIYEQEGELMYDSSVYKGRPLKDVNYNSVIVAKPIELD